MSDRFTMPFSRPLNIQDQERHNPQRYVAVPLRPIKDENQLMTISEAIEWEREMGFKPIPIGESDPSIHQWEWEGATRSAAINLWPFGH